MPQIVCRDVLESLELTGWNLMFVVLVFQDLDRQVVKSDSATFSIPELEFEQPPSKKGGLCYHHLCVASFITY